MATKALNDFLKYLCVFHAAFWHALQEDVDILWPGKVHLVLVTVMNFMSNCFALRAYRHLAHHMLLFGFQACKAKKYHLFSLLCFVSLPLLGEFWVDKVVHYGFHSLDSLLCLEMFVCIFYVFNFLAVDGHRNM